MIYSSFIATAGFISDPFASTDSDREERLSEYFVPPPYFASVMGDPSDPEASIVFSPRGTGKSALRRMVEEGASNPTTPYLALTYMDFEWAAGQTPTVEDHQLAVARLLTLAILTELDAEPNGADLYLDEHDKNVLKTAASALLTSFDHVAVSRRDVSGQDPSRQGERSVAQIRWRCGDRGRRTYGESGN